MKDKKYYINICIIVFLLLLTSCGSAPQKSRTGEAEEETEISVGRGAKSNDINDVSWLTKSDFKKKPALKYQEDLDHFPVLVNKFDSTSRESLGRVKQSLKEDLSEQEKDKIGKGAAFCHQDKFNEGLDFLGKIYHQYKDHPSYWNQIGTCYLLQGQVRKALLYYGKSTGIKRDYLPPLNNLGVISQKQGKDQNALTAYEKASNEDSFALTPIFNLAHLYFKFGLIDKGCQFFSTLDKNNKKDIDVLNGLATCSLFKGRYPQSLAFYKRIPRKFYKKMYIGINYALSLRLAGKKEEAKKIIQMLDSEPKGIMRNYFSKVRRIVER